jgi:hypothetical protein
MKIGNVVLSVSALALAAMANAASGPAYNPATTMTLSGTVTSARMIPAGQPLEGLHLTLKTRTNIVEVYVAPRNFMNLLKTNFAAGDQLDVIGSKVKSGSADVVLAREVSDGTETIELRDLYGAPVWENWGVEVDPAAIH